MKKLLLKLFLLISIAGYSQNAVIGNLSDGARTVTFTNPSAITFKGTPSYTNTTGYNKTDGTLSIEFQGGSGGYTYIWSPAAPASWTTLGAGNYSIQAQDSNGCLSAPYSFTINRPEQIQVTVPTPAVISCYGKTGSLTAEGHGGFPYSSDTTITRTYYYSWYSCDQNGANATLLSTTTDPTINGRPAGYYKVVVTDSKSNPAAEKIVELKQNEQINAVPAYTHVKCKGEASGAVTLNITKGTGAYNVSWTDGASGITRTGLLAGTYYYTITDANVTGCSINGNITITEPATKVSINPGIIQTQPSTPTAFDGRIKVSGAGGTGAYTYKWYKGNNLINPDNDNDGEAVGLDNGTYHVVVTDQNGCYETSGDLVLNALAVVIDTHTDVKCYGANTGSITARAFGGLGSGYSYQWYAVDAVGNETKLELENDATINTIKKGTYRVKVNEGQTPTASVSQFVDGPNEELKISCIKTNPACFGGNGKVTITTSGGTVGSGYTYLWSNGSTAKEPNNLVEGTYWVTVTDANLCTKTITGIVMDAPDQILISQPSITKVAINGQNTGKIEVGTITGGVKAVDYKYSWSSTNGFTSTSKNIAGLQAGFYKLVVTDDNNCIADATYEVIQNPPLVVTLARTKFITCNGKSDGEITATVSGGDVGSEYNYAWFNSKNESIGGNAPKIIGLPAENYRVDVTDFVGAKKTSAVFTLVQPDPLVVSLSDKTNVLCYGNQTGAISINVTGGTAPYTYKWTKDGADYSIDKDLINLKKGLYNVIVTDAIGHGCTAFFNSAIEITEPLSPLKLESITPTHLTGFGTKNGSLKVVLSGGKPNYSYNWTKEGDPSFVKTTNEIIQLDAGIYHLNVKDANECPLPQIDYEITQPKLFEVASLTQTPNTNILCNGDNSGEFTIEVTGGVKEYTFEWLNKSKTKKYTSTEVIGINSTTSTAKGLEAGDYVVSVKDQNNNTLYGTNTFTITQPDILAFTYTKQDVSCHSGSNGTITLNITGGTKNADITKPYNIVSSGGTIDSQNGIISGLTKGIYTVRIIDANGCQTQSQTIEITEPVNSIYIASQAITPTTGFGLSTGKVVVTVSGGTAGYTYQWKNSSGTIVGTNNPTLNNVPADTYTLSVTDANGCPTGNTYIVPQPTKPVLTETHIQAKCNGLFGSLNAVATGGASYNQNQTDRSYTYKLRNKISGVMVSIIGNIADFINIADGDYALTATDIAGVDSNSIDVTFQQPTPIVVNIASKLDVSCFGGQDGLIALNVTGGTPFIINGNPDYTYIWKKKNLATNLYENFTPTSLSTLFEGVYAVEVRDANYNAADATHCVGILSDIVITQPADFGFEIDRMTYQNPTAANGNDGALHFEIKGGKTNYEYKLYTKNAQGNETVLQTISNTSAKMVDFTNLIKDHYYVSVQDDTGCTKYTDFDFTDNPLTISISQTQEITCFESNNGILKAVVAGGFGIKTISWYRNNILLPNEHNAELLNVKIGNYYAVVKDTKAIEVTTAPLAVTQPDLVTFTAIPEPVKCLGDSNGTITINAAGGNGTFRYRYFNNGILVQDWTNFTNTASTIITGLADGEYDIHVQDTQECTSTNRLVKITSPTALAITNIVSVPATGKGLSNGSISITAQGANGSYTYNWFKENGTAINQTTSNAVNLAAGKYYIVVADAKSCNLTSESIEVTEPPLLETSISVQNVVLCNGDKNGSLKPTTIGGFLKPGESYTYQWFETGNTVVLSTNTILNNIGKGSYYAIAKDSNGNLATSQPLVVTEPDVLNNVLTADYVRCGDFADWTIDATTSGGTLPYSYAWNTGDKTASIQNAKPGFYSVIVTDNHGCNITKTITLTAPAHLDASEVIKIPTCYEGSDATITVTTIDGTAPFKYLWNTGETSNILKNASAGEYSVEITDARGCIILRKYTIVNPPKDVIDLGPDVTLCFDQTLTINATIDDDKATYFWTSDKGFTSNKAMITVSEAANYTVVVTNKLGCKATDTIKVSSQQTAISAEFAVSSQVFKNEKFIIVDISNPAADSVEWVIPANATIVSKNDDFAEISFSEAGEYDITINTTKGNCTAYQTKTVLVTEGEYEEENPDTEAKNFDLKIYPNPSSGNFTVDVTLDKVMPANVKVYSLNNNLLIDSKTDNGKTNYLFNFSLSGLPSGIYFVLFESQQGSKLRKIIIQ